MTSNPFEFSAANDLSPEEVVGYYIEDFNYSRFIQSKRNIFLLGERGSGKTMTLLFNSLDVELVRAQKEGRPARLERIGIYIPCNAPLMHRREFELLDDFRASVVSEHGLVLSFAHAIMLALNRGAKFLGDLPEDLMLDEFETMLGRPLPEGRTFFERVLRLVRAENFETSLAMNKAEHNSFYERALTFATFLLPLLDVLTLAPSLAHAHFLLMLDDADYLNRFQNSALNSWIAYRDHSKFSFKVATAKVSRPSLITASGGSIIEGHDYTVVDMEKPLHNENTDFGHLAQLIISRRLERLDSQASPKEFFPESPTTSAQLEECKTLARAEALEKYPGGSPKQISDYVYKYHRAIFFRRPPKANLPQYAGFEMIVFLSTGVVRNLLEPCYWMYDKALSQAADQGKDGRSIKSIDPSLQNEVIMELSGRTWQQLGDGLDHQVSGCTTEQAEQINRLFDALARLFRDRLYSDVSEPRATSFTISGKGPDRDELEELLNVARKALLLYTRSGAAKEGGAREQYYVPRRMLWPLRGLDPLGQHARVSLKAKDLMSVARGAPYPWTKDTALESEGQGKLFDD